MATGFSDENLEILRAHLRAMGSEVLAPCPVCKSPYAMANGIFAKWVFHPETNGTGPEQQPTVQVVCPKCFVVRFEFVWILVKESGERELRSRKGASNG